VDATACEQNTIKLQPITPSLTPCPSGKVDDGRNCVDAGTVDPACTGGTVTYSPSAIWDDTYGYTRVTKTPRVCPSGTTQIDVTAYSARLSCPTGYSITSPELLCYPECPAPNGDFTYSRRGAICYSSVSTLQRDTKTAVVKRVSQNQAYSPKMTLSEIEFPYCDFSSPTMLDRMAQFYYNKSFVYPESTLDGSGNTRITVQYITKFYGVIASSELSCDVVCEITFASFDLVTGHNYVSSKGCISSYQSDTTGWKGCPFCFRRFYFVHDPSDPQGVFTVTACTFTDYTAPMAMIHSTDLYAEIPVSLSTVQPPGNPYPLKTWMETDKQATIFDPAHQAATAVKQIEHAAFGVGGLVAMIVGTEALTFMGYGIVGISLAMTAYMSLQAYAEKKLDELDT
jgi:hypothetical protein